MPARTSPTLHPPSCASIVATSTVRVNPWMQFVFLRAFFLYTIIMVHLSLRIPFISQNAFLYDYFISSGAVFVPHRISLFPVYFNPRMHFYIFSHALTCPHSCIVCSLLPGLGAWFDILGGEFPPQVFSSTLFALSS